MVVDWHDAITVLSSDIEESVPQILKHSAADSHVSIFIEQTVSAHQM
jgi:hypothetical protein